MSSIHSTEDVRNLLTASYDEDYDTIDELAYATNGQEIDLGDVEVPEGWVLKTVDVNTDRDYDSYGNAYTEDGYIVFSVSDGTDSVLYKLPVAYASYEGWDIELRNISQVKKTEKVVTTYEWTNAE